MSIWWSLHLRREAASVPLARRLLLGTMETAGVDPDISYDLSVALTEACANAVEHAAHGEYRVTARIEGDRCRIEVADSGPGFAPDLRRTHHSVRPLAKKDQHAEHGRGLFLIEALVDHVHFHNRPGHGAVVSFDKILKWRDDSLLKVS
ncbi:ATP-binding protein [Streptomyces sp. NBC_00510]|jgi:serine/threonine-protein kinase RsbW|uniref:Serine/threonine-protein kinase RsbW n=1 Tax=Actinacidiphila glaucinigra TaxID=235986 RepID=A0A239HZQ0_9ACTN|nr:MULTISPECIES: ATP-binding protein [Streptomycetaceae]MDX2647453.1 ATP-binding protein [Streptomyces sp. PA03-1a]MDX2706914.1 ATP-binding protein [Streptomyces sp. PA03-6a]MDX2818390.1 ATP-binding protein [Streptomyces sp. PA03-5A]MDX2849089.1 ATP-binding protein [Streptomyces sp. PA03-3a]MDX3098915.1 ATP-binding protein [Streptomyces sp. ME19-03-3]MDX3215062.1 ATP-binding protein [Streptomyces sp. ME02-6991-2B]MDX3237908.1 ATP-binding protein [Streptomyces sp. ME03-5709C]MDX3352040.1 ATP